MYTHRHQPASAAPLRSMVLRALTSLAHPSASLGDVLLALEDQGLPLEESGAALDVALQNGWLTLTDDGDLQKGPGLDDDDASVAPTRVKEWAN